MHPEAIHPQKGKEQNGKAPETTADIAKEGKRYADNGRQANNHGDINAHVKEDDAGNYSLVVLHDKESSATPSGVRRLLNDGPPFTRKNGKFPG